MKRWVKWTLGALAALVVVAAAAAVVGTQLAERKSQRQVRLNLQPVTWATAVAAPDAATLERGKYLFNSRGCAECHGSNGAGREFINDGKGLRIAAPNISPGEGSVVARYTPEDWERTVRHGVKPNGHPVFIMPSEDYNRLTDDDLAAVVAYAKSLPPAKGRAAVVELSLPVRLMYGYDAIQDAAQKIDHSLPPSQPIPAAVNAEHGAYVANMCIGCHGPGLSGGKIPGTPPDWAAAANLTPGQGSALARYPDAGKFVAMLRSGKRPDGTAITVMPFESLRQLNDVDAQAVYAYLKTVPARPFGQR
ncbi:c-type cytochrome [Polaromonas naphthalenivorans]|uniref:Cytochrome c, class I n=1 Tax=Polaromonas naphthalenivorans (strain CJ2) TaxID=365044 RepID=A1VS26_POLNA|nr:c-type cytochrome [Polaromonas naphthalenivorans]ABM38454.1 cytochrome c, class I [Polaromonas naphthalenivorans CJ2]